MVKQESKTKNTTFILTSKEVEVTKDKKKVKFPKFFVRVPTKTGDLKVFKAQLSDIAKSKLMVSNIPTPCTIKVLDSFVKTREYTTKDGKELSERVVVILDLDVLEPYEFDNVTIDDLVDELNEEVAEAE